MKKENWNLEKSAELYRFSEWGDGYFDANEQGNLVVRPERDERTVDLYELVVGLRRRGIEPPILCRFDGIIRDRARTIRAAFQEAIAAANYRGQYHLAFPVKVNQQQHVVETVRLAGNGHNMTLEVGSKPELLAVLAVHDMEDSMLLCNGYKDAEYIELALLGRKVGRRSIIIVEQFYELKQIIDVAAQLGVEAEIGLRMKPITKGIGRWEGTTGDKAKFGLTTPEILAALEMLKEHGRTDWLKLMHFHMGSQISSISTIKRVLKEATRMYVELAQICPSMCLLDVGGGLGVDYDGSKTNFESSMNYSPKEYAEDVVYAISEACDEAKVPHPSIISESGRALVAHHSVLVAEVLDVASALDAIPHLPKPPSDHPLLLEINELYSELTVKNLRSTLNNTLTLRDDVLERFIASDLTLAERAYAETVYRHLLAKLALLAPQMKFVPEEIERVQSQIRDIYFCNFSLFQSLPDSWAIDQLFPIMPIHRLNEEPTRRAILADLTCDSDGQIDRFIDLKDVKDYLLCHPVTPENDYYLGIFMIGAYQEILGDLHNLFGDTNAVHVNFDSDGKVQLTEVVRGDTISEVLNYVHYNPQQLRERIRVSLEKSLARGDMTHEEVAKFERRYGEALDGYTYLVK